MPSSTSISTRGNIKPMPIAIPVFAGGGGTIGADITGVVSADLERSGLFQPIDSKAFVDQDANSHIPPHYNDWRVINAQALVTGSIQAQPDGRLAVEFRLWDIFAEQQLTGLRYTTTPDNWRRIAHIIADAVYKRLTGEDGYFDTRIVYISESGPLNQRIKRLAIMDQDGANHRYLTDGKALVLTPRFSPTAQEITYLSYARGTPRVYLFNIDTGQQEVLGDFPGMSFAPRFSPDGNRVIMSIALNGASQIYSMDLRTRRATQITSTRIDRHLALLFAGFVTNRLQFRSRRLAAALCDERRWQQHPTHQLRQRPLRHAGLVAARRSHRLHQVRQQHVLYRHHAARRLGRAAPDPELPRRRPDLGAQWPRACLFPAAAERCTRRRRALAALFDRSDRL